MSSLRELFIVDTDAGIDDAQAILLLLSKPNVELLAITTTHGNTSVENVNRNVLRTLKAVGRNEIPVHQGTCRPLLGKKPNDPNNYHGSDGFGDANFDDKINKECESIPKDGVQTLINKVQEHPGKINLVCLGPLTNIALAIRLNPLFINGVKALYIMGGTMNARGNTTTLAEFNFYQDPEAAYIVMEEVTCPVTLITWELCVDETISWDDYEKLRSYDTSLNQFLRKLEYNMTVRSKEADWPGYIICDELVAAVACEPSLISESSSKFVTIELSGLYSRGLTIIDWEGITKRCPNVRIVKKVDRQLLRRMLSDVVQ